MDPGKDGVTVARRPKCRHGRNAAAENLLFLCDSDRDGQASVTTEYLQIHRLLRKGEGREPRSCLTAPGLVLSYHAGRPPAGCALRDSPIEASDISKHETQKLLKGPIIRVILRA